MLSNNYNNNDNNKKNPHLNFVRRIIRTSLEFGIQTKIAKEDLGTNVAEIFAHLTFALVTIATFSKIEY